MQKSCAIMFQFLFSLYLCFSFVWYCQLIVSNATRKMNLISKGTKNTFNFQRPVFFVKCFRFEVLYSASQSKNSLTKHVSSL